MLERSCKRDIEEKEAFKVFKEAHNLWQKVLNTHEAESYYVYKQITVYEEFIKKYMKYFNSNDFNNTNKMINTFISNIERKKKYSVRYTEIRNVINRLKDSKQFLLNNYLQE